MAGSLISGFIPLRVSMRPWPLPLASAGLDSVPASSAAATAALTAALMESPLERFRRLPQRFVMAGLATERRIVIAASPTKRQPLAVLAERKNQNNVLPERIFSRRRFV